MRQTLLVTVPALLLGGCIAANTAATRAPAGVGHGVDYSVWAAGRSTPVADPLYPGHGTPGLDVLHYGLRLGWRPATGTLTGTATLRIRPTVDASGLVLDFKPYALDSVTVDGRPVQAAVTAEKLVVPGTVARDKPVTLVVRYHGRPSTTPMPSHRDDITTLGLTVTAGRGLWTMQEPYGAFTWFPANDQPSDKALYDIAVTVPTGWSAIASGTPAGRIGNTFRYRSADPVATYLTTLAVGKYRKISATGPHDVPLTYWYRPGTDDRLVPTLKKSPGYLAFLEKRFGPYPFPSGGAVIVDGKSAMETQQMVTIGGQLPDWSKDVEAQLGEELLHEYAHQWFGDSVTPKTWTDLWLNEGWAMYAQLLYDQSVANYSDDHLESYLRSSDASLRKELGPPGHPRAGRFAESNVYLCPAGMLKELNDALGDKRFFALARAWVQTQKGSQQDRASFIAFVNRHSGRDFTKLITTWLDSRTTPK